MLMMVIKMHSVFFWRRDTNTSRQTHPFPLTLLYLRQNKMSDELGKIRLRLKKLAQEYKHLEAYKDELVRDQQTKARGMRRKKAAGKRYKKTRASVLELDVDADFSDDEEMTQLGGRHNVAGTLDQIDGVNGEPGEAPLPGAGDGTFYLR